MLNVTDLGTGTAVVWVHGFPLTSGIFENQLAIRRMRHLMPDLPGFGQSRSSGGDVTIDGYARIVIDLLNQRGIDRAVLAGLSMGGYICLAAARLAPERLAGLILLDTRAGADSDEGRKGRYTSIETIQNKGLDPIIETMLPKMLTTDAPEAMRKRVREIMTSVSAEGAIAALRAMATRPDATDLLPAIHVPTLVIVGEKDAITPPAEAEKMAAAIPGAALSRIAGAAHLANYEQADEVNRICGAFLSKIDRSRSSS